MNIVIGADHAGFEYAAKLREYLETEQGDVFQVGAKSTEPYDYPDASDAVAKSIRDGEATFGVLICGSGIGVCIRANRYFHIRAAQCFTLEMAQLARRHNHANVLCLGERTQEYSSCVEILKAFLETEEDHAPRHGQRVNKLDAPL